MSDRANIVVARRIHRSHAKPSQPSPKTGTPVDFSPLDWLDGSVACIKIQREQPPWLAAARGKQTQIQLLLRPRARTAGGGVNCTKKGKSRPKTPSNRIRPTSDALKQICRELLMVSSWRGVSHAVPVCSRCFPRARSLSRPHHYVWSASEWECAWRRDNCIFCPSHSSA